MIKWDVFLGVLLLWSVLERCAYLGVEVCSFNRCTYSREHISSADLYLRMSSPTVDESTTKLWSLLERTSISRIDFYLKICLFLRVDLSWKVDFHSKLGPRVERPLPRHQWRWWHNLQSCQWWDRCLSGSHCLHPRWYPHDVMWLPIPHLIKHQVMLACPWEDAMSPLMMMTMPSFVLSFVCIRRGVGY